MAIKPTQNEFISWVITPSIGQDPVRTEFVIENQDGDIIYSRTYTDGNGMNEVFTYTLPATYTVPMGLPFERYVARVDYYSAIGWEAQAKAAFFVSQDTGSLIIVKYDDLNLNGIHDPGEPAIPGIGIRLRFPAPFTDTTFFTYTDASGMIVYPQLGTGVYTLTEIVPVGTEPTQGQVQYVLLAKDMTTTVRFGNATIPGSIEVFKFHDHNGNGLRDPEDEPLSGVQFDGSAPCGQTASGVSDASGMVFWPRQCVGDWTITETVPTDYRPTTDVVAHTTVTSGVTSTVSFGNQGLGDLVVFKFEDKNGNGVQDVGEPPWPGVIMSYLNNYGDTDTCSTDASGVCRFSNVPEGVYTVTEALPINSEAVITDTQIVTLTTSATVTTTFANRKLGALEVLKFEDENANGVRDAGEPAWPGVSITYQNTYGDTGSCVTDADGRCMFHDLPEGVYTVTETLPPYSEAVAGETLTTTVDYNGTGFVLFPNRRLGNLQIIKFEDINGNGVRDAGEPPWPGVAMTYENSYGDNGQCTTDANGACFFGSLPTGLYTITEAPPADSVAVGGTVLTTTLPYALTSTVSFANRRLGSLSPHVFWDINGNGSQDPGEPDQSGAVVDYINAFGDSGSNTTNSTGDIFWGGLPVGTYTTTLVLSNGCSATTANPSVDDVFYRQTTYQIFGYRCMLYLPLVLRGWPPPTPTPTATPTATSTPTPTATPTATPSPTPTPTPPPPYIEVPHPKSIDVDTTHNTLYIVSLTENRLYVADGWQNSVIARIPVGRHPYGVGFNPAAHKAYVANVLDDSISVIDTTSNTLLSTIPLQAGSQPSQVAVNPDTNKVYVTEHGVNRLVVIDSATDSVIKTVPDIPGAFDVVVNRPDNQIYVSSRDGDFISILDGATDTEVTRLYPGGEPFAMAFDATLKQLYVLMNPAGPLSTLDTPSLYLPLPERFIQESVNPNVVVIFEVKPNYDFGKRGYRYAGQAGEQGGIGIAANPTTGHFFVSNTAENSLTVFEGAFLNQLAVVSMDGEPGDVAVNPATNRIYVSNRSANVVHMLVDNW